MRLIKAKLINVCQHAQTEHTFPLGITLIKGPNGAGKSNLIKMIKASLTGDFSSNPPPKEANVRRGISDTAESYIWTEWEHAGTRFDVTRALQAKKNCLNVDGISDPIHKITDINSTLEGILGISKRVVDEFVFVDQWEIFSFMSAIPSVRAKTFSHLCNTERSERLWEVIGTQIKNDAALAANFVDNSEDILERVAERNARLDSLRSDYTALEDLCLKKAEGSRIKAIVDSGTQVRMLEATIGNCESRVVKLTEDYLEMSHVYKVIEEEYDLFALDIEATEETLDKANDDLNVLSEVIRICGINELSQEILESKPPKKPRITKKMQGNIDNILTLRSGLAALQADFEKYQTIVDTVESSETAECPTCGTDLSADSEHYQAIVDSVDTVSTELSAKGTVISKTEKAMASLAEWDAGKTEHELQATIARNDIVQLNDRQRELVKLSCDEAPLAAALSTAGALSLCKEYYSKLSSSSFSLDETFHAKQTLFEEMKKEYEKVKVRWSSIKEQVIACQEELATAEETLSQLDICVGDLEEAEAKLDAHRSAKPKRDSLRTTINDLKEANRLDQEQLGQIEDLKIRTEVAREWLEDLEYYREIFHRDALPKLMAQTAIDSMVNTINRILLEDFGAPFYTSADDNLSFMVHKNDGTSESAERLSGGEKVVLAIAFRLAVNSIFAGEVGMMVLDEPTAGLDAHNIDCLVDLFARLEESSKSKGQQIIIITHDDRLERACDNVLTISKD